jgi:CheY-like chemotaxis protein
VLTAATGEVALQLARERVPDLILLDMLLPDMGGECVLRKLKGDPATMRIPVLVLSGLSEANSTKLRQEGAADYFQKGRMFDDAQGQEAFLDMIREVLRESQVKN